MIEDNNNHSDSENQVTLDRIFEDFVTNNNRIFVEKRYGKRYMVLTVDNELLVDDDYCFAFSPKRDIIIFPSGKQPKAVNAMPFDALTPHGKNQMMFSVAYDKVPKNLASSIFFLKNRPTELTVEDSVDGVVALGTWKASFDNQLRFDKILHCYGVSFLIVGLISVLILTA